jgi:hypothetical protein
MWPFKQPYKKVKFNINLFIDPVFGLYRPIEGSGNWPWGIAENLCIIPEERNVLIKKIIVQQIVFDPFSKPVKDWKFLYKFLDRSEAELMPIRGNVQNPISGAFFPPAGASNYFTSNNSYKSVNDFGQGIVAGGLNFRYFEMLGYKPLTNPPNWNSLFFSVSVYYQDIDE